MKQAKKRILVLTDHMPWGHRSIAKAIYGYLKSVEKENNLEVYYAEVKSETGMANDLYTFIYRYMPGTNKLAFTLYEKNKLVRYSFEEASKKNLHRVKKEVEKIKPDLVISAYFFHTHSLAKWREETCQSFKLWSVVADPWTINPVSIFNNVDLNLVYDEVGVEVAKEQNIPVNKVLKTGWWVRPNMYTKYNREEARKKLGFYDDRPIIFLGGGSLGTSSLPRILPALLFLKKKVGFVINTGTDKLSYNLVENYIKFLKQMKKDDQIIIKNFGWIDNMAEILSACDMVFGKAGPNFLFDVVATEKPFVSITHISGQEDGNIDLIKKKNLGWVKEKNGEITKFLVNYLEKPEYYQEKYKHEIKAEAKFNQKSLPKVLEMVMKI
jgi:UDP-N-acetylglucosamine:LPS N-acetylglucosamine transferase